MSHDCGNARGLFLEQGAHVMYSSWNSSSGEFIVSMSCSRVIVNRWVVEVGRIEEAVPSADRLTGISEARRGVSLRS